MLCLFSLVIGAAIGHVTVRSRTTDATSYAEAKAGDEYTTRFIVVGDWGRQGQYHQQDVAMQMALVGAMLRPQFVISTGDNFYPSGLKRENDTQIFDSFTGVYEYPSLKGPWYSGQCRGTAAIQSPPPFPPPRPPLLTGGTTHPPLNVFIQLTCVLCCSAGES